MFPQVLSQTQILLLRRSRIGETTEFLHEIIELDHIIIDVFIAVFGIEFAGEFSRFVGGNLLRCRFYVVANLVARSVVATTSQCELVRGGPITRSAGDLGPIFLK